LNHAFVANGASKMQWSQLLITQHIQIHNNVMRQFDRRSAIDLVVVFFESRILFLLAPLSVANLCFIDLVLVDESDYFLFLAIIPYHVTDFIDNHHVSGLLVTGHVGSG